MFWLFLSVAVVCVTILIALIIIRGHDLSEHRSDQVHEIAKAEMTAVHMKLQAELNTSKNLPRALTPGERDRLKEDLLADIRVARAIGKWDLD